MRDRKREGKALRKVPEGKGAEREQKITDKRYGAGVEGEREERKKRKNFLFHSSAVYLFFFFC